jgi:hypothetical protein
MSICFICEQSISEDEKPVGARGRQTLLTASVTRGHSDHEKLLLSDETVCVCIGNASEVTPMKEMLLLLQNARQVANKGIYMFVIN